jgi:hypothetical protein
MGDVVPEQDKREKPDESVVKPAGESRATNINPELKSSEFDPSEALEGIFTEERSFGGKIKESSSRQAKSIKAQIGVADALIFGIGDFEESLKKYKEVADLELTDPIPGNWFTNLVYGASKVAYPMAISTWQAKEEMAIGATVGTIFGGIESLVTPILGDEPIGVLGSMALGAKAGWTVGSGTFWWKQGVGEILIDLHEQGIDITEDKFKHVAMLGALPYAGIEYAQMSQLMPGLRDLGSQVVKRSIIDVLKRAAIEYGSTWVQEVGEEVLQEAVLIATEDLGRWMSDRGIEFDYDELMQSGRRLYETLRMAGHDMALLPLGKVAAQSGMEVFDIKMSQRMKALQEESITNATDNLFALDVVNTIPQGDVDAFVEHPSEHNFLEMFKGASPEVRRNIIGMYPEAEDRNRLVTSIQEIKEMAIEEGVEKELVSDKKTLTAEQRWEREFGKTYNKEEFPEGEEAWENFRTFSRRLYLEENNDAMSEHFEIWMEQNEQLEEEQEAEVAEQVEGIPEDLQPLAKEARKYKSAEEFVEAQFSKAPEYGMTHRPAYEEMPPAYNLLEGDVIPRDVYEHPEFSIASGRDLKTDKAARESWNVLQKIRNNPEAEVTVYRAGREKKLNIGDWITFSKEYASQSLEAPEKVYSYKIKAKDAIFAGDDINEFGYYPKSQLIDIWNEAHKQAPKAEEIPGENEIFIRAIKKSEKGNPTRSLSEIPDKEGYDKVYKPYGAEGKGFYYVPKAKQVAPEPTFPAFEFDDSKTGVPLCDRILENPEYYAEEKNMHGRIIRMSPQEYQDRVLEGSWNQMDQEAKESYGGSKERFAEVAIGKREGNLSQSDYIERWEQGERPAMPVLEYGPEGGFMHEGFTRSVMAEKLGVESMPVFVMYNQITPEWDTPSSPIADIPTQVEDTTGIDETDGRMATENTVYDGKNINEMTGKELNKALKEMGVSGMGNQNIETRRKALAYIMEVFPEKPAIVQDLRQALAEAPTIEEYRQAITNNEDVPEIIEINRNNTTYRIKNDKASIQKVLDEIESIPSSEALVAAGIKEKKTSIRTMHSPNKREIGDVYPVEGEDQDWIVTNSMIVNVKPDAYAKRRLKETVKPISVKEIEDKISKEAEPATLYGFYMKSPDFGEAGSHSRIPDPGGEDDARRPMAVFKVGDKYFFYKQSLYNTFTKYLEQLDGEISYGIDEDTGYLNAYKDGVPKGVLAPFVRDVEGRETTYEDKAPFEVQGEDIFLNEQSDELQPDETPVENMDRVQLEGLAEDYVVSRVESAQKEITRAKEITRRTGRPMVVIQDNDNPGRFEVIERKAYNPDRDTAVAETTYGVFDDDVGDVEGEYRGGEYLVRTRFSDAEYSEMSDEELKVYIKNKDLETGHARDFTGFVERVPQDKPWESLERGDRVIKVPPRGTVGYAEDVRTMLLSGAVATVRDTNHETATIDYPDGSRETISFERIARVKDGVRIPFKYGGKSLGAAQMPSPPPKGISVKQQKMIMALSRQTGLTKKNPKTGETDHSGRYEFLKAWTGETSVKNLSREQASLVIDRLLQLKEKTAEGESAEQQMQASAFEQEVAEAKQEARKNIVGRVGAPDNAITEEQEELLNTMKHHISPALWQKLTDKYGEPVYVDEDNYMTQKVAIDFEREAHKRAEQYHIIDSVEEMKRENPEWYREYEKALDDPRKRKGKLAIMHEFRNMWEIMERMGVSHDHPETVGLYTEVWEGKKLATRWRAQTDDDLISKHGLHFINSVNEGEARDRIVAWLNGKEGVELSRKEKEFAKDIAQQFARVVPYDQYGKILKIVLLGSTPKESIGDYDAHQEEIDTLVNYARTHGLRAFRNKYWDYLQSGQPIWGKIENYYPRQAQYNNYTQELVDRMLNPKNKEKPGIKLAPSVNIREAPTAKEQNNMGLMETLGWHIQSMVGFAEMAEPMSSLVSVLIEDITPQIEDTLDQKRFVQDIDAWVQAAYGGRSALEGPLMEVVNTLRRWASAALIHQNPAALIRNEGQVAANDPATYVKLAKSAYNGYKPSAASERFFNTFTEQGGDLTRWLSPNPAKMEAKTLLGKIGFAIPKTLDKFCSFAIRHSLFPATDTINRYQVYYGWSSHLLETLDKTETAQEFIEKSGLMQRLDPGHLAEAIRIYNEQGQDAFVDFVTLYLNWDINYDYELMGRSPAEIKEAGKGLRVYDLLLWSRNAISRISRRFVKLYNSDVSFRQKVRLANWLASVAVGSMMAGWTVDKITGRPRRTYKIFDYLPGYTLGGLTFAVYNQARDIVQAGMDAISGERSKVDSLFRSIEGSAEMFVPGTRVGLGILDAIAGKLNTQRYLWRGWMEDSPFWGDYKRSDKIYDRSDRPWWERIQRIIGGRSVWSYKPEERRGFLEKLIRRYLDRHASTGGYHVYENELDEQENIFYDPNYGSSNNYIPEYGDEIYIPDTSVYVP